MHIHVIKKEEEKVLLQNLINRLLKDTRTNAWVKDFLASIGDHIRVRDLSEKQMNILNKIKQKCKNPHNVASGL